VIEPLPDSDEQPKDEMKKDHNIFVVGLPDSGKTNYIIRLWLALRQRTGILHAYGDPDDIEYLEIGVDKLLRGEFAGKTSHEVREYARIPVAIAEQKTTHQGDLVVPDYHGEVWQDIYRRREWSEECEELISNSNGLLLFIRADSDEIIPALDWISAGRYFGSPATLAAQPKPSEAVTPTPVVLVEWLQFFRSAFTDRIGGSFLPRIGIVVAAWDMVPNEQRQRAPEDYIESNFPMLMQFIRANGDGFVFKFFGVSITGGDLKDGNFRSQYLKDPTDAGYVIYNRSGSIETTKDLTYPVAWAMGLTDGV
jgi:hypothetical protein